MGGKEKLTRGTTYQKEGKRLSIKDQNKIKAKFDLPEGVNKCLGFCQIKNTLELSKEKNMKKSC